MVTLPPFDEHQSHDAEDPAEQDDRPRRERRAAHGHTAGGGADGEPGRAAGCAAWAQCPACTARIAPAAAAASAAPWRRSGAGAGPGAFSVLARAFRDARGLGLARGTRTDRGAVDLASAQAGLVDVVRGHYRGGARLTPPSGGKEGGVSTGGGEFRRQTRHGAHHGDHHCSFRIVSVGPRS
jgi:hypothetical protein